MKILPEQEEFLQCYVRDCLAINPMVPIRKMQELVLTNTGRSISDKYLARLMLKIRRQVVFQSDQKKISERLAEVREKYRVLSDQSSRIAYWRTDFLNLYGLQEPSLRERLAAIKTMAYLETSLFKNELYAGMFENKQLAIEQMLEQGVLPTELREQVIGVFRTWKLAPATREMAEPMELIVAEK